MSEPVKYNPEALVAKIQDYITDLVASDAGCQNLAHGIGQKVFPELPWGQENAPDALFTKMIEVIMNYEGLIALDLLSEAIRQRTKLT